MAARKVLHRSHHHEAVPETSAQAKALGEIGGRLLPEARDAVEIGRPSGRHEVAGLDPAVLGLRAIRNHAEQHEPIRPSRRRLEGRLDTGHEARVVGEVMSEGSTATAAAGARAASLSKG